MKRIIVLLFTVVFVLVCAVVFGPSLIDWGAYKDQATQEVKARTGLDVNIEGSLGFSIVPSPRFFVENVKVLAPEGSKSEHIISFDRLDVNVALMPLFQKKVDVQFLTLIKPMITLELLKNNKLNVMTPELEAMSNQEEDSAAADAPSSSQGDIKLDKIRIKDGTFSYFDHTTNSENKVQNINVDLSATSLLGPYKAQGSLFYDGYALNYDISADNYDAENKIISPKVKLVVAPGDLALHYEGVVSFEDAVSIQGQTALKSDNFAQSLQEYDIDSSQISDGPLEVKGLLTADDKKIIYDNVKFNLNGEELLGRFDLALSPFSYNVTLKTASDLNVQKLLKSGYDFKSAAFSLNVDGNDSKVTLKPTTLQLDDQSFKLSGSYTYGAEKKRALSSFDISTALLDYDALSAKMPQSSSNETSDIKQALSGLSLPVDLDFSFGAEKLVWQKKTIQDLDVQTRFRENSIVLDALNMKNIGGAAVKISGDINDLKTVSGITSYVEVNSSDIHSLGKWIGTDTQSWPANLKKAHVKTKATGSLSSMNITSNISAMGGQVIAKGLVQSPSSNPTLKDLELQLKHKNMAEAIKILSAAVITDKNLRKPLDFYAKVSQSGQTYTLNDIKGDLSGISVTGDMTMNMAGAVPDIKGELKFGKIKLESIVDADDASGGERWSKDPVNTSGLHAVNADIKLSAQNITYGPWPLVKPKMSLKLSDGVLDITDLSSGVFGGSIALTSQIKAAKQERSTIHFQNNSTFKNVDIGQLTKALVGTDLVKLSGKGGLDLNVKSSGISPAALVFDLNGKGVVNGKNITLKGVDVTRFVKALSDQSKPGDTISGLWKGATKGGETTFATLNGAFDIKNGVANINQMVLDGPKAKVETTGTVDMPKWYLSTKHNLIVKSTDETPSDVPPFEMTFKGSLDNPTQTFGQGLLNDYLNRKIQRKFNEVLSDKLGFPSNDNKKSTDNTKNDTQDQKSNKTPDLEDVAEDAIKGLLGDLLK